MRLRRDNSVLTYGVSLHASVSHGALQLPQCGGLELKRETLNTFPQSVAEPQHGAGRTTITKSPTLIGSLIPAPRLRDTPSVPRRSTYRLGAWILGVPCRKQNGRASHAPVCRKRDMRRRLVRGRSFFLLHGWNVLPVRPACDEAKLGRALFSGAVLQNRDALRYVLAVLWRGNLTNHPPQLNHATLLLCGAAVLKDRPPNG